MRIPQQKFPLTPHQRTVQQRLLSSIFHYVLLSLILCACTNLHAQSRRHQQPSKGSQPPAASRQKRAPIPPTQVKVPAPKPAVKEQVLVITTENDPPPPAPPAPAPVDKPATSTEPIAEHEEMIRINSNLVTVPASVVDHQGKAVTDLNKEDFELRIDGQPKPISELGRAESPVRLALLFDNSSSLTEARAFEMQAAVRFFRSVMRPIDKAAIYSVSTVPALEQPLTGEVDRLVRTIENFDKPEGATALFDTIAQAAAYLKPFEGRKVIVIVSDGADTISDLTFEATLQRVLSADCQIYVVQTGQVENANLRDLIAERRMQEFAFQTGGAVYRPKGTTDLDTAFAQISADLAQQYVLSYYPAEERRDGLFRVISLRVKTRPNLRVRARRGYYAPKA